MLQSQITFTPQTCSSISREKKSEKIADFLNKYGDYLPPEAIKKATTTLLPNFQTICNEKNEIISVGTWEKNDWYLCTMRYLATDNRYRGKGLGTKITEKVIEDAMKSKDDHGNDSCLVFAADITSTNEPSKKIIEKMGFESVSQFYWSSNPNDKADILHFVRYKKPSDFK